MTIGIGLICSDGIVLAADTLYEGGTKTYGRKLWGVLPPGQTETTWCLVGSGTDQHIRAFRDLYWKGARELLKHDDLHDLLQETVSDFWEQHVWVDDFESSADPLPQFLIAIRAPDNTSAVVPRLYSVGAGATVARVSQPFHCIGSGVFVAEYLAATLFRAAKGIETAAVLAAYVIQQTKLHAAGCGGDTHISTIPTKSAPYRHDDEAEAYEAYFKQLMKATGDLAYSALDGVYNDELRDQLTKIQKELMNFREEFHQRNFHDNADEEYALASAAYDDYEHDQGAETEPVKEKDSKE